MPNKDKNIPKRRFKEFENADAWELRKLGEVAEINPKSQIPEKFEYVDLESVVGTSLISHRTVRAESAPSRAQRLALPGDIFYQTVRPYQKNNYLFDLSDDNYVFSTGYAQLRPKIDSRYLMIKIQDDGFVKEVLDRCTGTSYPAINSKDLSQISIDVPTSLPEQEAIGTFFSTLDRQITLHQRKLDKLKSVKQAYLSEMFPAEGERVPKRRFPGFTDDWELRKLGEVVYRSNLTSSSKDLPRLEFEDINSGLGTLNKDISQKVDDRKGLEFNEGDVLFGKLRPYLKNWWYAEFKGIALGDFWNLKSDLWHSCFLYTYIQSNSFQLVANDTSGTKMPRSDWNLVAESIAKFPSFPEQTAIGTFFSTLDRHITLHQRKLEKLKNLKKALLNELFV
ncbi:TPA: restriction endonuclease subunit S [Streptococcus suis]|nr:restriction endonuclease subunit S [Streptococcus suis]